MFEYLKMTSLFCVVRIQYISLNVTKKYYIDVCQYMFIIMKLSIMVHGEFLLIYKIWW